MQVNTFFQPLCTLMTEPDLPNNDFGQDNSPKFGFGLTTMSETYGIYSTYPVRHTIASVKYWFKDFCSNIFVAKQDFCFNILGAKQKFCSNIMDAKEEFCSNILDAEQNFCSNILGARQNF